MGSLGAILSLVDVYRVSFCGLFQKGFLEQDHFYILFMGSFVVIRDKERLLFLHLKISQ